MARPIAMFNAARTHAAPFARWLVAFGEVEVPAPSANQAADMEIVKL